MSSPSFSILVNGSPKGFFKGSRGLRQGDTLSPYLFIMAMDLLGRMISKAEEVGLPAGFSLSESGPSIPFIQFADDSLFLIKNDVEYIKNLRGILLILEGIIGLKVNLSKSTVIAVGKIPNIEEYVYVLRCSMAPFPINYLGRPLGAKSKSKSIWSPMIERMGKRISSWKGRYLSKGGKLVLLRSVYQIFQFISSLSSKLQCLL